MEISVKESVLMKCPYCNKVFVEGRWSISKGKTALISFLNHVIVSDSWHLENTYPEDFFIKKMPKKVEIAISFDTEEGVEELTIPFKTKNKVCDSCQKSQGQYFEGFLQLRNAMPDQIEFAKEQLNKKGAIKKEKIKDDSADFVVSSNKAIIHAIRELSKNYHGIATTTSTLHTQDKLTSKELHRVTGLFKFIQLAKNDVVNYDDNTYMIIGIDKKNFVLDKISKKSSKISLPLSKYESIIKVDTFDTTILRTNPILMILDENYQPQPAISMIKSKINQRSGKAVRTNEGFFLIELHS
jgi:NMD protein affecting ribosome stability and mRNA decay